MMLHFSKKHTLIVGIITLIIVLFIVFAQVSYLSPLKADLQMKKESLTTEQKLLELASQKKTKDSLQTVTDTRELQKKLPVEPLQEQLILDLEKAETVSNSQIKSMGFTKGTDAATTDSQSGTQTAADKSEGTDGQSAQNTTSSTNSTQSTTDTSSASSAQSTANQTQAAAATPALKKLTVSLSVESPSYEDLEKFIDTLESLQRIVVVESISYSGGQEVTSAASDSNQPLSYSLTVSAFYMPSLTDLAAQLPKIDAPAPAGKENPLPQDPILSEAN